MYFQLRKDNNRGFTLIETLVAVSVLLIAVASPLVISQRGVASAGYAKEQLVAAYLAQDALEGVRAKRDENGMRNYNWLEGFAECVSGPCIIDTSTSPVMVEADNGEYLRLNAGGLYQYDSGTVTPYKRTFTLETAGADREVLVKVTVSWQSRFTDRQFTVSTRLFNIR